MVTSRFTLGAALVVLIQLIAPTGAAAQASREGPSFAASGGWGTVRLPDVAYDAAHGVYMAVSGNNTVGRFVGMNGDPVGGQFSVSTSPTHNQSARVAYSPDLEGFLVVWYDTRVNPNQYQVWGRIVRFDGAGPQFLTGDFFIGAPTGGANGELGIDVSYAFTSKRFLVAYNQIGPPTADIVAQLVDTLGNLVGGPQPLSLDDHWQREPSIAYDARYDNFMVAWGVFYNPAGPGAVHVRTVSASTGALGPVREVATGSSVYVPQVEYNDATQHFFVAWYTQPSIWGTTLAPDGTPVTNTSLVAYNYASYDGLGLSYNPVANTYFAIFHGRGSEDVGAQVSAAGVPDVEFTVTATPGIAGNYNPRVTSHNERGEWLVVTSSNFAQVTGQRVRSAGGAPPP
ncbi:MAG: hypothetical protein ACHQRO_14800, partial [Vicinamibacteria bacterium]